MYEPTSFEITAARPWSPPPAPVMRPVVLPADIPPGVDWVTLPNGVRTLAYTHTPTPTTPPAAVAQPIPAWAKTTALLVPTTGAGIAAAGIGLSYAAPGLIAMSHALWSAAAVIATSTIAVAALIWAARNRTTNPPPQITQNITATGLFGRATATINH